MVVGGILYPIWTRFRSPSSESAWQIWFWPRYVCLPAALLAVVVRLPEYARLWFDTTLHSWLVFRANEPQEFGFALFLLIYLWSLRCRLNGRASRQGGGARAY